jgi:hypothetical protein
MTATGRARWATKSRVALAVMLALASIGVGLYAMAAGLAAPTITSGPSDTTNKTSATFAYSHPSAVTFECSLDASTFTGCGTGKKGSKTYSGLAAVSHTFQVRAVLGSQISSGTSFTWTIDTTAPTVLSIGRAQGSPTNASAVSWTVTFAEAVTGVNAADFDVVQTNASPAHLSIGSLSGAGAVYTVSATTTITTSGTIRLDLVDDDTIKDPAGNALGGPGKNNGSFTGQAYVIDKVAPPKPVITDHPSDPSSTRTSTFAWTDTEAGVTFRCEIDQEGPHPCTSPYTFTVPTNGGQSHQFKVRAVDAVSNESQDAAFTWKVSDDDFDVSGDVCCLYPGAWRSIDVSITNPNTFAIDVTQITVAVSSSPAGCPSSWMEFQDSPVSESHAVTVPGHSTIELAPSDRPQIRLRNEPVNQDACQNQTIGLRYGGLARHP